LERERRLPWYVEVDADGADVQPDQHPTSAQMPMGVAVCDPLQTEEDEARRGGQRDEDLEGARGDVVADAGAC
jgi:hypothetical protein